MARQTRDGGGRSGAKAASAPASAWVAIAAPSAAADRLVTLFAALPPDTRAAFVVTLRDERRDAGEADARRLADLIGRATSLAVEIAADGQPLQPDHVYVADPADLVTVESGRIRTAEAPPAEGRIEALLISVAEAYGDRALVVALAGLDGESAAGAAAARRHGGFAIAEDADGSLGPAGRSADGMADKRVAFERIAPEIAACLATIACTDELQTVNEELQAVNRELAERVRDLARANSDLKNLLESTQIASLFLDNDLRLRSFTPASSEVFNLTEADVGRPIAQVAARVSYPELQEDARNVLASLGQVERQVANLEEDRRFLARVLPYRSVDNFVAGVVVTFLEITGASRAQAALRASERRFSEAQQLAGVGVWECNLETDEEWWSPVVYQLWGLAVADKPPPRAERPVHPEDREAYDEAVAAARQSGELNIEWRVTLPDGSLRWLAEVGRLERAEGSRRMLGVTQDVTERKQTETRLTLLLGELQHRVRNILGVVRSVIARSVRNATNVEDLAAHIDGRLQTLARTQGVLTRTGVPTVDLEELIRDELVSVAAREEQLTIRGPSLRLRREAAEMLALALHELTTNAVKYGALSEPSGKLSITWRVIHTTAGKRLALEWKENGVRALDTNPARSGFGRELIERGLPYELGADTSLEFARGGVRATIEAPLTEKIADFGGDGHDAEEAQP